MPERKVDLQLSCDEIRGIVELLSVAEKPITERINSAIMDVERQVLAKKIDLITKMREYLKGRLLDNCRE
jgi:hypothetical protein